MRSRNLLYVLTDILKHVTQKPDLHFTILRRFSKKMCMWTNLSEVLESKNQDSYMQAFIENLSDRADRNDMQANTAKTKETILGPLAPSVLPILSTRVGTVNRVSSFKLLGVYIESTLTWSLHIDSMVKKATQRLYFLNNLKEQVYQVTIFFITTAQLYGQYLSTVFQCGTTPWLRHKLNRSRPFRREPSISS